MKAHADEPIVIGYIERTCVRVAPDVYKIRADLARAHGVRLVQIVPHIENLRMLEEHDSLRVYHWNGTSLEEFIVSRPAVCHDVSGRGISRANRKCIMLLADRGTKFVNPRQLREKLADKWVQYEIFSAQGIPMPRTELLDFESLQKYLTTYSLIFIKPRIATQGRGQVVIEWRSDTWRIKWSDSGTSCYRSTPRGVWSALTKSGNAERIDKPHRYIIQQGVAVRRLEGRVFDFRVVCQKGPRGRVYVTGCYARVGPYNSHQANISKAGHPIDPSFVFENWRSLRAQLCRIAKSSLSACGDQLGEAGIDLILNERNKLICLEINTRPGSKGFSMLLKWVHGDPAHKNLNVLRYRDSNNHDRAKWGRWLKDFRLRPILYLKECALAEDTAGETLADAA